MGRGLVMPSNAAPGYPLTAAIYAVLQARKMSRDRLAELCAPSRKPNWLEELWKGRRPATADEVERLTRWPGITNKERRSIQYGVIQSQVQFGEGYWLRVPAQVSKKLDLVAISPINNDYIVPLSATGRTSTKYSGFTSQPEEVLGSMRAFEAAETRLVERYGNGGDPFGRVIGGSAANVIQTAARAKMGLSIGLVGVVGMPALGFVDADRLFRDGLLIHVPYLRPVSAPAGRTLSVVLEKGEEVSREMATWPGGNALMHDHLLNNFWALVGYLSDARIVHVTSLFDRGSPEVLATLLEQVRERSKAVLISFDPGHVWAKASSPVVERLLQLADIVFLSSGELYDTARHYPTQTDATPRHAGTFGADEPEAAAAVLSVMASADQSSAAAAKRVVIVKNQGATSIYTPEGALPPIALTTLASEVEDDTGAGDAFAAGFLVGRLRGLDDTRAAHLGMLWARAKLGLIGPPDRRTLREAVEQVS